MQKNLGINQRSDLTFKHNLNHARHGWLRLTPAYSVKLVNSILSEKSPRLRVLDPFSGTATTTLCASNLGHAAVSTDINPFLVWFGKAKVSIYETEATSEAECLAHQIQNTCKSGHADLCPPPPIANIERWWSPGELHYLRALRGEIDKQQFVHTKARDLLLVAFCRTLMDLSNAAFNHQSMSFKNHVCDERQQVLWSDESLREDVFLDHVRAVIKSAEHNPQTEGIVLYDDARQLCSVGAEKFDLLITSPPYSNRMSYIRELRDRKSVV